MTPWRRFDPRQAVRQPWANGAGYTDEWARDRQTPWSWRLSVAMVERTAPFSPLPGVDRQWVALDAPIDLLWPDGRQQRQHRLSTVHADGATAPQASLPQGPTRVFNLMQRGDASAQLIARPLQGLCWLPASPHACWLLYLLGGSAELQRVGQQLSLSGGEALWLPPGAPLRLDGRGELLLVHWPQAVEGLPPVA